ncbi:MULTISPECIES: hypothetical protein [Halococcus]|uniref:Uncharacterized protein n=1 Tax=Halococcus salifodinae DSM 8989 TaxID=1227456 RepID=M0MYM0_9EURY|nr:MULTISPECIES: hypothetical protein [Halococcus]EMA49954.1 hypothetical protein C450_16815 [Halococcus salifodinae DSM 8989]
MADEIASEKTGQSSVDEDLASHSSRLQKARLAAHQQFYAFVFQILLFITMVFVPIATLLFIGLIDTFVPSIPVVAFSPLSIQMGGEGIRVTKFVMASAVVRVGERLWVLNSKGWPEAASFGDTETHDQN